MPIQEIVKDGDKWINSIQKDILYRQKKLEKAKKESEERENKELDDCTFVPKIYSIPKNRKKNNNYNYTVTNDKYTENHVRRQYKARQERQLLSEMLSRGGAGHLSTSDSQQKQMHMNINTNTIGSNRSTNMNSTYGSNSINGNQTAHSSPEQIPNIHNIFQSTKDSQNGHDEININGINISGTNTTSTSRMINSFRAADGASTEDDETLIEMIDRERRDWHKERMQFVQCIQLQQVELEQRAVAAHDRAAEIAKEFARAIGGFEERLCAIEDHVHKETMGLKSIAESLRASTPSMIEQRIDRLDTKLDAILSKLS